MVLTLELPIRPVTTNLFAIYEQRFGALPDWLDDLHTHDARALLRLALRRGAPLASADQLY